MTQIAGLDLPGRFTMCFSDRNIPPHEQHVEALSLRVREEAVKLRPAILRPAVAVVRVGLEQLPAAA